MAFVYVLLGTAALCCVYGIVRSMTGASRARKSAARRFEPEASTYLSYKPQPRREQIHWIQSADLPRMLRADHDYVLFRIRARGEGLLPEKYLPGEAAVTVDQLEETLVWTPPGSRIIIYHAGQNNPELMRRVEAMALCREAFLVADGLPLNILKFAEILGAACSLDPQQSGSKE